MTSTELGFGWLDWLSGVGRRVLENEKYVCWRGPRRRYPVSKAWGGPNNNAEIRILIAMPGWSGGTMYADDAST